MPIIDGMGVSPTTRLKQTLFRTYACAAIPLAANVMRGKPLPVRQTLLYFDLSAGSGEADGIAGSPMIALQSLNALSVNWHAYFFEELVKNCKALSERIRRLGYPSDRCTVVRGDVNRTLPATLQGIPSGTYYGFAYHDPNGRLEHPALVALMDDARFWRVDVLLYVNGRTYLRSQAAIRSGKPLAIRQPTETLQDVLLRFRKQRWSVGSSMGDRWDHRFCLGTNHRVVTDRFSKTLFPRDTPAGAYQWDAMIFSRAEQPPPPKPPAPRRQEQECSG